MSNKNPYEIRLECLQMAKEMMDREYEEASTRYWEAINHFAGMYGKNIEEAKKIFEDNMPKMYQPEEMMKKAKEFYDFVNKTK